MSDADADVGVDDQIRLRLAALADTVEPVTSPDEVAAALATRAPRSRRRPIVLGVVGAAATILAVALVLPRALRDAELVTGPTVSVLDPGPTTVPLGADAPRLPTWIPDGIEPWSVLVESSSVPTRDIPAFPEVAQLLRSTTDDAAMLLTVDPHSTGQDGGAPIAIRGTTGHIIEANEPLNRRELLWTEQGVDVKAALRNVPDARAVAVLDALVLRDPAGPRAGFAVPDASWKAWGDPVVVDTMDDRRARSVTLQYWRSRPDGVTPADLEVITSPGSRQISRYLRSAFEGTLRADGVAIERTPALDTQYFTVVWPDEHVVVASGRSLDEATAERIARGVVPVAPERIDELRAEVTSRLSRDSVLAAVDLPSGRLELMGDGDTASAICLRDRNGARDCGARHRWPSVINCCDPTGADPLLATVVLGETWYVFGASRLSIDMSAINPDHGRMERAADGGWTFGLLVVPTGSASVDVDIDGNRFGVERAVP